MLICLLLCAGLFGILIYCHIHGIRILGMKLARGGDVMTEQQQTFLELYRKYESILREQGLDYFTVSEQAEDSVKNKMNLMRQMRNFLVHTDSASFVSISQEQLVFLEQLITMQSKCGDTLKKHLVTMRKCSKSLSSSVFDAIALLLKYDFFSSGVG